MRQLLDNLLKAKTLEGTPPPLEEDQYVPDIDPVDFDDVGFQL